MTESFDAAPVLEGLTGFQLATVDHVVARFFGNDSTDRFLVADQTGLGKTMVARGVIARTIERLQHDPAVDRVDIVYICANQDLARQNLRKLDVGGGAVSEFAARLSLLGAVAPAFPQRASGGPAPINLVSFTPGTSFTTGWQSGTKEERALLFLLLEQDPDLDLASETVRRAALSFLRCGVRSVDTFADAVEQARGWVPRLDPDLVSTFLTGVRAADDGTSLLHRVGDELARHGQAGESASTWQTVGELRAVLARASVSLLTPDLVILDEFQRFRDLLGRDTEAGELAHHLFDAGAGSGARPKVLLLSATPYKPFTYAEESAAGDDHHRDFMDVVRFLGDGSPTDPADRIDAALKDYREGLIRGDLTAETTMAVREEMLRVMCRTERPDGDMASMRREVPLHVTTPSAEDLVGHAALAQLSSHVGGQMSLNYWKDIPAFANFMTGYRLATAVQDSLAGSDEERAARTRELLARTHRIDVKAFAANAPLGISHARLAAVQEKTIGEGWWKLLWVPPSLPYLEPGGAYADLGAASMSKLLVFSSWAATPTAVSSLLSYEADRLTAAPHQHGMSPAERSTDRRSRASRLSYRWSAQYDRPGSMSTLALFWPMPGLASLADPLEHRRAAGGPLSVEAFEQRVVEALRPDHPAAAAGRDGSMPPWSAAMRRRDSLPCGMSAQAVREALATASVDDDGAPADAADLLGRHIEAALAVRGKTSDTPLDEQGLAALARIAAHSPGNIAWRALRRVVEPGSAVTEQQVWAASARLAVALRALFARPETTLLLDSLDDPEHTPYWHRILRYCAEGNLQAVFDEHLHHVAVSQGGGVTDADALNALVMSVSEALSFRASRYGFFDPERGIPSTSGFSTRFAARYGNGRGEANDGGDAQRQHQVRQAFNSPFWPFVLASTSVGQEGIDFHWWCRSVLHWNTPANPVDFEQREGRVDRYDGLAVRRNIVAAHGEEIFATDVRNPWSEAYEVAARARPDLGSFAPHWVYPGEAKIDRYVALYPLSVDQTRLEKIKRDVARYRLAFGQPRQEDLLQIVHGKLGAEGKIPDHWRVDLTPPPPREVAPPDAGRGGCDETGRRPDCGQGRATAPPVDEWGMNERDYSSRTERGGHNTRERSFGARTLGDVLTGAQLRPDDVLVIRHTEKKDGLRDFNAVTPDQVRRYTRGQLLKRGKFPADPPRWWLVFLAEPGLRARLYTVYDNAGEARAERTAIDRFYDLRDTGILAELRGRLVIQWTRDAINWAKRGPVAWSLPVVNGTDR